MSLFEDLVNAMPDLLDADVFNKGIVILQDDSDGLGAFIVKWDYDKPMPEGFKLGK